MTTVVGDKSNQLKTEGLIYSFECLIGSGKLNQNVILLFLNWNNAEHERVSDQPLFMNPQVKRVKCHLKNSLAVFIELFINLN